MFEAAELGRTISKTKYEHQLPQLRSRLLQAHFALRDTRMPVIILVSGADGAGKGEFVHRLNEWLDPRGVDTVAFSAPSDEERERPPYWRFWRALPARGRIGILFGSWYSGPIIDGVYGKRKKAALDHELDQIAFFERMLADDDAVIIKLWFHLSKSALRNKLKAVEKDPSSHWRVLPRHWKHLELYDKFRKVTERALRHTDAGHAPWHVIEATDRRYRELTAGMIIVETLEKRLRHPAVAPEPPAPNPPAPDRDARATEESVSILDHVDLDQRLTDAEYRRLLEKYQSRLGKLVVAAHAAKISTVATFEGWDAAGKGSAIRRVTAAMDPRLYRIIPVSVPTDEERAQHYLWRFWRHVPRAGMVTIYDRTWYGRLLVERVEGFATDEEWQRAFLEINNFEEQLTDSGMVVAKFWVHISKAEQLRRFKQRQEIAFKQYKITDEDWRNREKWDAYKIAVSDMVARTSTEYAPWTIVAGNDKKFARIQILKTICKNIRAAL
jgi:AMP-polyphosphate phosphotransferase